MALAVAANQAFSSAAGVCCWRLRLAPPFLAVVYSTAGLFRRAGWLTAVDCKAEKGSSRGLGLGLGWWWRWKIGVGASTIDGYCTGRGT